MIKFAIEAGNLPFSSALILPHLPVIFERDCVGEHALMLFSATALGEGRPVVLEQRICGA